MTTFQRETMQAVLREIEPLLQMHWEEIAHFKDICLAPDFGRYEAMERAGVLRIFTARRNGELIGYAVFMVCPSLHYRGSVQAAQDILFVAPQYRAGRVGVAFIMFCDDQLRDEGVQVSLQHVKAAHDFGPMLVKLGYQLVDLIYARRLDHGRNSRSSV